MIEQMRKEFEDWASRYHGVARIGMSNGVYSNECVSHDWNVWQASRQSLVVKLPEVKFWLGDKSLECIDDFKKQLDAAGVKCE